MARVQRFHPDSPRELDRYLIPTEKIIFSVHRHWLYLIRPILASALGLLFVGFLQGWLPSDATALLNLAVVGELILIGWLIYKILDWWRELFLATDRRLILLHGVIIRQVDIMPMAKVTDMRYVRTIPGKIFGFGRFVLESAGQDQALSVVNYVPHPDLHYRQISNVLFGPAGSTLTDQAPPVSTGSKLPIAEPDQAWWQRR